MTRRNTVALGANCISHSLLSLNPTAPREPLVPMTEANSNKGQILVVDDNPTNLHLLANILKKEGYQVRPAVNGKLAISSVKALPPDLILLDIMMPDLDGYETCIQIKANEVSKDIPIIFLSALNNVSDKIKAFQVGGVDYISKPFQKEEVIARIESQLRVRRLQKEIAFKNKQLQEFSSNLKQLHRLNTTNYHHFQDLLTQYLQTGTEIFNLPIGFVSKIEGSLCQIIAIEGSELEPEKQNLVLESHCLEVINEGKTYYFDKPDDSPDGLKPPFESKSFQTLISTPIWVKDTLYGTLVFASPTVREKLFTVQEVEAIELMAQSLGKYIITEQAEQQRQEAEEDVQLLLSTIQAISATNDFNQALAVVIQQICEKTGWIYGEAWIESVDGMALECSPSWYRQQTNLEASLGQALDEFRIYSEVLVFLPKDELPGLVWVEQEPIWVADLSEIDDPFLRLAAAIECGLKTAFAVPIAAPRSLEDNQERRVLAVLIFFLAESQPENKRLTQLVSTLVSQLGRSIQQKRVEAEQRTIFAAMTDIIVVRDRAGVCIKIVPTNTSHLISDLENNLGKTLHELFPKQTADRLLECLQQTLDTRTSREVEYNLTIDNRQIWLAATISPLGEETVIWVARDISDQKIAEAALQESETRYRSFYNNTPVMLQSCDQENRLLSVSDYWLEFMGYQREEVLGRSITDFMTPASQIYAQKIIMPTFWEVGTIKDAPLQFIKKDGRLVEILLSAIAEIEPGEKNPQALAVLIDITERKRAELALRLAQQKSERLLLNILPERIAEQLKQSSGSIAEQFEEATILFADIVGFTPLSAQMSPIELVSFLNQIFSTFDKLAEEYGLEKIKTIGDAYMVVGGVPVPCTNSAEMVADMSLAMQKAIESLQNIAIPQLQETPLQIRIGIHTGSVVAGVIGIKKFIYDLWGDTVNIASRMESQGEPGKIQVTTQTYEQLKEKYIFSERGAINIKGKGEMITYWLEGKQRTNITI